MGGEIFFGFILLNLRIDPKMNRPIFYSLLSIMKYVCGKYSFNNMFIVDFLPNPCVSIYLCAYTGHGHVGICYKFLPSRPRSVSGHPGMD